MQYALGLLAVLTPVAVFLVILFLIGLSRRGDKKIGNWQKVLSTDIAGLNESFRKIRPK